MQRTGAMWWARQSDSILGSRWTVPGFVTRRRSSDYGYLDYTISGSFSWYYRNLLPVMLRGWTIGPKDSSLSTFVVSVPCADNLFCPPFGHERLHFIEILQVLLVRLHPQRCLVGISLIIKVMFLFVLLRLSIFITGGITTSL